MKNGDGCPLCSQCQEVLDSDGTCGYCNHAKRPAPTNERYPTERLAKQLMDSYNVCGDQIFYQASVRLTEQLTAIARIGYSCAQNGEDAMRMRNIATAILYPEKAHIYDNPNALARSIERAWGVEPTPFNRAEVAARVFLGLAVSNGEH